MRAGSLKHRLIIQSKSSTGDGMGGSVVSWTDEQAVWGAIWPLRGQDLFIARQMQSEVTHQIRIRYVSGITPEKRIRLSDSTTYFDILSPPIDTEYRHRELTIYARENV